MAKTKARVGTFDELLARAAPDMQKVMTAARKLVLSVHRDATEVVRLGDRAATYGYGPKKMSEGHTYLMPQKDYVNLGFYYGALLPDPEGLLEGTGAKMRHTKLRTLADVKKCRALVEAAVAERRRALVKS